MRILSAFASVFLMALTATAANAERRVAFVLGNGTYKNVAPLPNPPVDAKAMAGVLRNVGFEVVEGTNLTRDQVTRNSSLKINGLAQVQDRGKPAGLIRG